LCTQFPGKAGWWSVVEAKEPDTIESSGSPLETMPTVASRDPHPWSPHGTMPPKMPLVETRYLPVPIRQAPLILTGHLPSFGFHRTKTLRVSTTPVDWTGNARAILPVALAARTNTIRPVPGSAPNLGANATATSDECLHVSARTKARQGREMPDDECGGSSSHRRWRTTEPLYGRTSVPSESPCPTISLIDACIPSHTIIANYILLGLAMCGCFVVSLSE